MPQMIINVIGAGLAGCEAAWQAAKRGVKVRLYEMKPLAYTPAHHLSTFAELVCSNSLGSSRLENAAGLLKEEMRMLGSLIIKCADENRIPAGGALAVDRAGFSDAVTRYIAESENIEIINEEVKELPEGDINIIATGPLTSEAFSSYIKKLVGEEYLYFYDAVAPIVTLESINMEKVFRASRYGKGGNDYINCPFDENQYKLFWHELVNAEVVPLKEFEKEILFEGCMPVESLAKRGIDTLRYGPLKPVGLINPLTGTEPYAVVQLRQDNRENTQYNLVGFQTRLKWAEQKRVFRLIPGLENAEFVRYGVMHKNTYINSPKLLDSTYSMKTRPDIYFAGQITGVEGYVESASSGMVAGINAAMKILGKGCVEFPPFTAIGALGSYISDASITNFQPMNINFGLFRKAYSDQGYKARKQMDYIKRALDEISKITEVIGIK